MKVLESHRDQLHWKLTRTWPDKWYKEPIRIVWLRLFGIDICIRR